MLEVLAPTRGICAHEETHAMGVSLRELALIDGTRTVRRGEAGRRTAIRDAVAIISAATLAANGDVFQAPIPSSHFLDRLNVFQV